jgi:uncharacterized NAD(P)/FAD-binding protein YdhS
LPSDHHQILYERLTDVMARTRNALLADKEGDLLEALHAEHEEVLQELQRAGYSKNPKMLESVRSADEQLRAVVEIVRHQQDRISQDLESFERRRKQVAGYTDVIRRTAPAARR